MGSVNVIRQVRIPVCSSNCLRTLLHGQDRLGGDIEWERDLLSVCLGGRNGASANGLEWDLRHDQLVLEKAGVHDQHKWNHNRAQVWEALAVTCEITQFGGSQDLLATRLLEGLTRGVLAKLSDDIAINSCHVHVIAPPIEAKIFLWACGAISLVYVYAR